MTSLLPVCLALLLPACVLGQVLFYEPALNDVCNTPEQIGKINTCSKVFNETLSKSPYSYLSLEEVCRHIDAFVNHTLCLRAVWPTCVTVENQGLIQTDAIVSDSLHYLCDNINAADYDCATRAANDCARQIKNSHVADLDKPGLVDRTCRAMHTVGQCVHDRCTAQGHSMDVYDLYWRQAYAPACSSLSRSPRSPSSSSPRSPSSSSPSSSSSSRSSPSRSSTSPSSPSTSSPSPSSSSPSTSSRSSPSSRSSTSTSTRSSPSTASSSRSSPSSSRSSPSSSRPSPSTSSRFSPSSSTRSSPSPSPHSSSPSRTSSHTSSRPSPSPTPTPSPSSSSHSSSSPLLPPPLSP